MIGGAGGGVIESGGGWMGAGLGGLIVMGGG